MTRWWGLPRVYHKRQDWYTIHKLTDASHHIYTQKKKNHIISVDAKKKTALQTSHSSYHSLIPGKTLRKLGVKVNFLYLLRAYRKKLQVTSYLMVKDWMLSPEMGTRRGCTFSLLLLNIILEVLTNIMPGNEIKHIHIRNEEIKWSLFAEYMTANLPKKQILEPSKWI